MLAAKGVPVFKLYGETSWPTPDLIHCESIPERSRLHDWEIKTHRHGDLAQLLYVQAGQAHVLVEGVEQQISGGALQVVPVMSIHGFRFSEDIQGYVISLAKPVLERFTPLLEGKPMAQAECYWAGDDRRYLDDLFGQLTEEYRQQRPERDLMLQSVICALLVWLSRRSRERVQHIAKPRERGQQHLDHLTQLIEQHFREHQQIEHYARQIGVSVAHLNALCRQLTGQSALQQVNQRVVLEAKRNLVYTSMTIGQVADSLGFAEQAYFSRFFKRATGLTPKEFRLHPRLTTEPQ
ncbi:helix-turn-helix domain-containing protein [Pseudomonas sp. S60]|uniref:helix-turn-helix domain-containing protein n=1 Tax=Pseudomonas sp. S60 TaxID=211124 RepID=UPI001913F771|nr:helix-turn-helix domain-containing protein [Pseudomonas sp. S60]MBK5010566.1 helix-turn-helix domain-containing protein [Pseudomonas sp. S60]